MGFLVKNVIEPAFIVTAFTIGCLINRRRAVNRPHDNHHPDLESGHRYTDVSPPLKPIRAHSENPAGRPPNLIFRLLSRFFYTFPFLIEIWYWLLTYWVYQLARAFSARMIAGNEAIFDRAQDHAIQILAFERFLGIAVEQPFQQYILTYQAWIMPILAKVYYSHISVGVCFIIYIYTVVPPPTFQRIRRTIAVDNAIAFVIITLWRCYPPRLLPPEYGFIDVLHTKKSHLDVWNNNRFQLTIAAIPSLHFGTALFFAVTLCRFSPHRLMRILAPLWPTAMLITIVATANHFLIDAIIGAVVPVLGWKWNRIILILEPIQSWFFRPLISRLDLGDNSNERTPIGTIGLEKDLDGAAVD